MSDNSQKCQICKRKLDNVFTDQFRKLITEGTHHCLRDHINKSKSNKREWLKIANFFSKERLWIIEELDLKKTENIAFGLPKLFYIYCLLPYVHEAMEHVVNSNDRDLGSKDVFSVIRNFIRILIDGCKEYRSEVNDLIDDIKRLIEHYSKHPKGAQLLESIIKGFNDSRCGSDQTKNDKINYRPSFNCITDLRQAYWSNRQPEPRTIKSIDRTIRINGLPFAESAYIYYLSECASDLGINLEIVDVNWNEVGLSLLTGRIDIAVHNNSLWEQQLPIHGRLAQNRLLYCSEPILQYKHYYRLVHKKNFDFKRKCIAIVRDSDYYSVFNSWLEEPTNKQKFLTNIDSFDTKNIQSTNDFILPVSTPDLAVSEFLDGEAAECLVGGIHEKYVLKEFSSEVESHLLENIPEIEVYFATLASSQKLANGKLIDIISSWRQVVSNWNWIKNGVPNEVGELQKRVLAHVNRQPNRAFISNFDDLYRLLLNDNKLLQTNFFITQKPVDPW